jgi:hypothetical protein
MGQQGSKDIVLTEDEKFELNGIGRTYILPCRKQDNITYVAIDYMTHSDHTTYACVKYCVRVYYSGRNMKVNCDTLQDAHTILDTFVRHWTRVRFEKYRRICMWSSKNINHGMHLVWNCYEQKAIDNPQTSDSPASRNGYQLVSTEEEVKLN